MPTELPYKTDRTPVSETIKFDGANFKTVTWKVPDGVEYKGKIIYVHGFCEDTKIYPQLLDNLSLAGYEVFFFDQRGSGETSEGKDFGITNETHVFKDLDFMIEHNLKLRTDPTEKLILGGHSMGGGIVLNYGVKGTHVKDIKAIFTSAPEVLLNPNTRPNAIVKFVGSLASKIVPNLKIDSKLNYDYITHRVDYQEFIKSHNKALIGSLKLFNDMMARGEKLLEPAYAAKFNKSVAVLILHGTDDNINDFGASKRFFGLLSDDVNKEFYPVEGARHSLFIEEDVYFKPVLAKVLEFLGKY